MEQIKLDSNSMVLHHIQLVDTQMISVNCNVNVEELQKEENIETNIAIGVRGNAIDDKNGDAVVDIEITSAVFSLNIVQKGSFVNNNEMEISKEQFEKFLVTQGIRLLWSFARENVYEISCKMLRKPIMLPTLDVIKTLQKK